MHASDNVRRVCGFGLNLGERRPALTSPSKSQIARGRSEVRVWGRINCNCAACNIFPHMENTIGRVVPRSAKLRRMCGCGDEEFDLRTRNKDESYSNAATTYGACSVNNLSRRGVTVLYGRGGDQRSKLLMHLHYLCLSAKLNEVYISVSNYWHKV